MQYIPKYHFLIINVGNYPHLYTLVKTIALFIKSALWRIFFLITVLFRCENDTYLNMQITNNNNKHKTIHRGSPTIQSSGKVDWIMKWPEKITSGKLLYTLRHIVTITLSQSISVIDISIFTSPSDIQRFRIRNVCNIIVLYIFYSIFHGCCLRCPYWARQDG